MPVRSRLPARLASLTLLLAFVVAAVYGKCLERERLRPHGCFNEPQIVERANLIGAGLITRAGNLHVHPYRSERQHLDGKLHPFWFLDYTSDEGESVLRLGFDGETGELHFATVCSAKNFHCLSHLAKPGALSSSAVLRVSRDWVYALGLAPKLGPWEVVHNPRPKGRIWQVRWRSPQHTLFFSFDRQTGRLAMAQIMV